MPEDRHIPKLHRLQMMLGQYPILGDVMRERMREEMYRRGVLNKQHFENEVREKARQSQRREGITNPYIEESSEVWERRLSKIRDSLTEFYWAYNLSPQLFEELAHEVLHERPTAEQVLSFNPEMASMEILFQQMEGFAALPPEELAQVPGMEPWRLGEYGVAILEALDPDGVV